LISDIYIIIVVAMFSTFVFRCGSKTFSACMTQYSVLWINIIVVECFYLPFVDFNCDTFDWYNCTVTNLRVGY